MERAVESGAVSAAAFGYARGGSVEADPLRRQPDREAILRSLLK